MTGKRWEHLKGVLVAAWDLDAADRPTFLDEICGEDAVLRADVDALLASDQEIGEFLQPCAMPLAGVPAIEEPADEWPGRNVGPYQILREIGHGGMGTVYLAERADGQYRKQVAIKLVNPQTGDRDFVRRFLRERQVLAGLEHPNVVRLLDGGTAENGLPYLVLEYVEGVRVDTWCETRSLPVKDCLQLFRNVCDAVEYAHRKGVIHLDIKPGNILVTAEGVPKLLDFGVARVVGPDRPAETTQTATGPRPMTPEYASPEQVRAGTVGPASDIYALGLVLHKLLTGRLPRPAAVSAELNGDLKAIVLKAMNPDPDGRYASAAALSDDLDRLLRDLPVNARKATPGYVVRKLVKRHRLGASLAAGLLGASIFVLAVGRPRPPIAGSRIIAIPAPNLPSAEALPPPPEPSSAPRSLAVVHIENRVRTDSFEQLEHGLCDLLSMSLANTKSIPVISADRVRELIARRAQGGSPFSADQARDVAREAHADLFLSGALTQTGTRVRLDYRIQETASGRTVHSDALEGADLQAIVAMADRASARILAWLTPGQAAPQSKSGAALTANLEALKSYEEGVDNRIRFHALEARRALQRAIELDPQFMMAHYHLADSLRFDGQVSEARRSIARALQLAERSPVPPLQRMLAQALQMRLDLRLDEAAIILQTAHREFPQETEPVYQLAVIQSACARFAESAALLEDVVRRDSRHPLAHDQLGYQYAFLGNVPRAIAAIDAYAALLPPKNEVPYCSRGDVYMINERYAEALAEYREIHYLNPMAVAALHAGDYGFVESKLAARRQNSARWSGLLGDLAAARGQIDSAAPLYEEAVGSYFAAGPLRPWYGLLSAARIYLEQGRPEDVLELGSRHDHPWAGGLRATAYLLLRREAEAEKEFAALRASISPILGEYVAAETIAFHRMLADSYAGRRNRVIETWSRLPRSWWSLYALDVGRAYLKSGVFAEAEHHLRLARKAQQAYFMNGDMQAQHNLLTWMLAGFYLGEVMEKTGRRIEAVAYYQEFAKHFENSPAALPQLATAHAVLGRFRLSERGKLVFNDDFAGAADHGSHAQHILPYRDAIFELSFRIDGAGRFQLGLAGEQGLLARFSIDSAHVILQAVQSNDLGALRMVNLDFSNIAVEPGKWHKAVVEAQGKRIVMQIDDKPAVAGESPALDVQKAKFALSVERAGASFESLRMYEVATK
ncbi:MAG: serine/threonine protein kinase with repeat [Candidatus Solibacter sp.]|nr:serine/threonine protein kinase with repeat [Candidatus Solibacter sp.]